MSVSIRKILKTKADFCNKIISSFSLSLFADGCMCSAGWWGSYCSNPCPPGKYGQDCNQVCFCQNNSTCDSVSGNCTCPSGYIGDACQNRKY